jgi:phenylacetate-CoA ligase
MEDIQVWELVDAETKEPTPEGEQGLTVCSALCSESSPQLRFLVGDLATFDTSVCECGITHVRAMGAFTARADDLINLRGVKMYPAQIEAVVRAVPGAGDEFEILLSQNDEGMDVMEVRIEHGDHATPEGLLKSLSDDLRAAVEVRVGVEVLAPGTLPKTEFKAKRVRDERTKN